MIYVHCLYCYLFLNVACAAIVGTYRFCTARKTSRSQTTTQPTLFQLFRYLVLMVLMDNPWWSVNWPCNICIVKSETDFQTGNRKGLFSILRVRKRFVKANCFCDLTRSMVTDSTIWLIWDVKRNHRLRINMWIKVTKGTLNEILNFIWAKTPNN